MDTYKLDSCLTHGFNSEQFYQLCQANNQLCLELSSQGELIVLPSASKEISTQQEELIGELIDWNHYKKVGFVFPAGTEFQLPNGAFRCPAASWVSKERWSALTAEQKRYFPLLCPDFVVEWRYGTESIEPLRSKMQEYLDNGAELGWLIDAIAQTVEIYKPGLSVTTIDLSLDEAPKLSGLDVLPGFVLDLKSIFKN